MIILSFRWYQFTTIVFNKRRQVMAYGFKNSKGVTYYLHTVIRELKSGKKQQLFFFAKEIKAGALDAVPAGYEVVETKTGLPVMKRK